jgi:hypothetical protein
MSQLFKTNLEEYARQCTLQRRRYEECLQQAQQSCGVSVSTTSTGSIAQDAGECLEANQVDACVEQAMQSCMIELLEMPVESLDWDDTNSVSDNARNEFSADQKWQGDRAPASHPSMANSKAKSPSPVGFGAP